MLKHVDLFDTSDYPKSHPNYSTTNTEVIGKFKDECNGAPVIEFIGLRAKVYSILVQYDAGEKQKATAKGIKTAFAKKNLKHETYKQCLLDETATSAWYYQIGSSNHTL